MRRAIKPVLLEHIFFKSIETQPALECLETFSSQDLCMVKTICIHVNRKTINHSYYKLSALERAWDNILRSLSCLEVVHFKIDWDAGMEVKNWIEKLPKSILWKLVPRVFVNAKRSRLRFVVEVCQDDDLSRVGSLEALETLVQTTEGLPNLTLRLHYVFTRVGNSQLNGSKLDTILQKLLMSKTNMQSALDRSYQIGKEISFERVAGNMQQLELGGIEMDVATIRSILTATQSSLMSGAFSMDPRRQVSEPDVRPRQEMCMSHLQNLSIALSRDGNGDDEGVTEVREPFR